MNKQKVYNLFFPEGKKIRFRKTRWMIMTILQEASMCKWKSLLKYFYKPSYRHDINLLRNLLSKSRLSGTKSRIPLHCIHYSHELNYPEWVEKLVADLQKDPDDYKRLKVFCLGIGVYLVIDGNHRLAALNLTSDELRYIEVLILSYKDLGSSEAWDAIDDLRYNLAKKARKPDFAVTLTKNY